jgi:hypothetical protein
MVVAPSARHQARDTGSPRPPRRSQQGELPVTVSGPPIKNPADALAAFRLRADTFFGHARVAELTAGSRGLAASAPKTATDALGARLRDVLRRLDGEDGEEELELRKSLTLHDGRVVAMTGDATPLGPSKTLRIVTTTTTILDAKRMRVETSVLMFNRSSRK